MKILENRKIKALFQKMLIGILVFIAGAVLFILLEPEHAAGWILLGALVLCVVMMVFCYGYFKEENEMIENAVTQITEYLSGNREARIACDEEGELYRLFHEINSLAAILNANAENERKSKVLLKNTISDISHQLKTPLAALNIYNGLLQEETEEMPELQEFTALSERELDRIETLVQNLLKLAKLDAGTIVFEKTLKKVADMMGEVELHFAYRARLEGKELVLSGENQVSLFCDGNWIIEAVENIVKNAFDHTEQGDMIRIEWKQSASMVQIRITDNGSGIHQEDLHHIFKRFYRSRFSRDKQGIGLGLPLAKMIVEAHHGTIEVSSEPGMGTVFVLSFLSQPEKTPDSLPLSVNPTKS